MNANNGVNVAVGGNASANLTLAGGVFNTKFFKRGLGTANITFNGGTVAAMENTSTFFNGISSVNVEAGGMTFDTAGRNVEINDLGIDAASGSSFTKAGAGTLTMDTLPLTEAVVVSNGTFAIRSVSGGDGASEPTLAHRWSFTDNLADSVDGTSGTMSGSGAVFENGVVKLPGGGKGTCYIDLGANKLPSDCVTLEFWMTIRTRKVWTKMFCLGKDSGNCLAMTLNRNNDAGPWSLDVAPNGGCYQGTGTLEANKPYYFVLTLWPTVEGATDFKFSCYNATSGAFVGSFTQSVANWKLTSKLNQQKFCLGYSFWNDNDACMDFDEVRVWNGALASAAITSSIAKGPDATAADLEEIVSTEPSVAGAVAVAWGGTLDLGGNAIEREYVSGGGTVINGTLTASKELRAKLGDCLTISGATFNIDGAKVTFSAEDMATLAGTSRTYTLVKAASGGTITGNLLQPATDAALPKGWHVTQTPGVVTLRKSGMSIHFR